MFNARFSGVDGWKSDASYETLEGLRAECDRRLGKMVEVSFSWNYAISGDGVVKVTPDFPITELYPGFD
jgi:hypothetical protein